MTPNRSEPSESQSESSSESQSSCWASCALELELLELLVGSLLQSKCQSTQTGSSNFDASVACPFCLISSMTCWSAQECNSDLAMPGHDLTSGDVTQLMSTTQRVVRSQTNCIWSSWCNGVVRLGLMWCLHTATKWNDTMLVVIKLGLFENDSGTATKSTLWCKEVESIAHFCDWVLGDNVGKDMSKGSWWQIAPILSLTVLWFLSASGTCSCAAAQCISHMGKSSPLMCSKIFLKLIVSWWHQWQWIQHCCATSGTSSMAASCKSSASALARQLAVLQWMFLDMVVKNARLLTHMISMKKWTFLWAFTWVAWVSQCNHEQWELVDSLLTFLSTWVMSLPKMLMALLTCHQLWLDNPWWHCDWMMHLRSLTVGIAKPHNRVPCLECFVALSTSEILFVFFHSIQKLGTDTDIIHCVNGCRVHFWKLQPSLVADERNDLGNRWNSILFPVFLLLMKKTSFCIHHTLGHIQDVLTMSLKLMMFAVALSSNHDSPMPGAIAFLLDNDVACIGAQIHYFIWFTCICH